MGCGDSKGVPEAPVGKGIMKKEQLEQVEQRSDKLQLYGDWFQADSRAVYAILKHAEVEFEF